MPPTARNNKGRQRRRFWYSVSVDTLRVWVILTILAALGLGAFIGYYYWSRYHLEIDAFETLGQARTSMTRLQGLDGLEHFAKEFSTAQDRLNSARELYKQSLFGDSLEQGRRALSLSQLILDSLGGEGSRQKEAHFIGVEGRVELRRGDGREWQSARAQMALFSGDHVRTGDGGSAEIMFRDGVLYTALPGTQFIVDRSRSPRGESRQAIRMDYGWVNLNTSRRAGTVQTPGAEAQVLADSEASVSFDRATRVALFANYKGRMEVESEGGEKRTLAELQSVEKRGQRLARTQRLPLSPAVIRPAANSEFDFDKVQSLDLAWEPVQGASRYALQVSRNPLFVDNVIDVQDRQRPRSKLGINGEGVFFWRVAAVSQDGLRGQWSPIRSFRVAVDAIRTVSDRTPPVLEIERVNTYGAIVIVDGRTEPAAVLTVNGELARVEADGSFIKTTVLGDAGWNILEVHARDASGNEAEWRQRIFVEIF